MKSGILYWTCTGDKAIIGTIATIATLGAGLLIFALANAVSKNPKLVAPQDFPDNIGKVGMPAFWARLFSEPDSVKLDISPAANPGRCIIALDSHVEWLKTVELYLGDDTSCGVVWTAGKSTKKFFDVPNLFLEKPGAKIILGKAKLFGILTQMYKLEDLAKWKGSDITFTWVRD